MKRFPLHGVLGILIAAGGSLVTGLHVAPFDAWTTPICWWGYVLFLDGLLLRIAGTSPLTDHKRMFFFVWLPLSVLFWILFELVNLHLQNWYYVNLPPDVIELTLGSMLAFATILPGMFLSAELFRSTGVFRRCRLAPIRVTGRASVVSCLVGFAFLIVPFLLPREWARYTFALVWMGFFFLLEPVNHASGVASLFTDLTEGRLERFLSLLAGGYLCGLLWEVWNFWSATKWVYSAPFTESLKYFEIPLAGFLGFGPFALEYFAMYHFSTLLFRRKAEEPSGAIAW